LSSAPPVIVLVRPQLGQNIGKAARAMLNFGLTEMRLVAPRDGWPNPDAGPAASGADIVLEKARVFDTVAEAIADCGLVYASTVRRRDLVMPVVGPIEMAQEIRSTEARSAILFGPERSGLESDDVALATKIVTVPINPEFGSLNLAQAVILLAYEWSKDIELSQPTFKEIEPPAAMGELDGLFAQLDNGGKRIFLPTRTNRGHACDDPDDSCQTAMVDPRNQRTSWNDQGLGRRPFVEKIVTKALIIAPVSLIGAASCAI